MTTAIEYALMAGAAYISTRKPINQFPIPQGWTDLQEHEEHPSGFEASAYFNGSEIVISYAGTYPTSPMDWMANSTLGAGVPGVDQLLEAAQYYLSIRAQYGNNISFTGHSLGGGLASLMGALFNHPAFTFDQAPFGFSLNTDSVAALLSQLKAKNLYTTEQLFPLQQYADAFTNTSTIGGVVGSVLGVITGPLALGTLTDSIGSILAGNKLENSLAAARAGNVTDTMLTRFTADLDTLVQAGGRGTVIDLGKALIAFAMEKYYTETTADPSQQAALFTAVTGGLQFDTTRINADITSAKGYAQYFKAYLENSVFFSFAEQELIKSKITSLHDWSIAVDSTSTSSGQASCMTATADSTNSSALMLGGSGRDNLTVGSGSGRVAAQQRGTRWRTPYMCNDVRIGGAGNDSIDSSLRHPTMQLKPQRLHHLQHRREIWHTFARKRFVQTLSTQTSRRSHLRHTLRTSNIAQGFGNKSRISAALFNTCIQIQRHLFWRTQPFSDIVGQGFSFSFSLCHHVLLKIISQRNCSLNVGTLARFITSRQQHNQSFTALGVIHPIPRPKAQLQFAHTIRQYAMLARVASSQPSNSRLNARTDDQITQAIFPIAIGFSHLNLHGYIVANGIQTSSALIYNQIAANDASCNLLFERRVA